MERRLLAEYQGDLELILQLLRRQDRGCGGTCLGAGADPRLWPCQAGQLRAAPRSASGSLSGSMLQSKKSPCRPPSSSKPSSGLLKRRLKPFLRRICHDCGFRRAANHGQNKKRTGPGRRLYPVRALVVRQRASWRLIGAILHRSSRFMVYWKTDREPIYALALPACCSPSACGVISACGRFHKIGDDHRRAEAAPNGSSTT